MGSMKKEHRGVSVIVPMYNAESTVKKCVDSLLLQDLGDYGYEIIIINDGSKDNSLTIVEQNYGNDPRVKIITQKNQGVSVARNTGIENAQYSWISFVDSDDTVEPNMYEEFLRNIENGADMALCSYNVINNSSYVYDLEEMDIEGELSISDFADKYFHLFKLGMTNSPWNKMFRRDIIVDNNIRFDSSLKMAEDAVFNIEYWEHSKKVTISSKKLYNYVLTDGQTIHKVFDDYYVMMKNFFLKIKSFLKKNDAFEQSRLSFYTYFSYEVANSISNVSREKITFRQKWNKVKTIYKDDLVQELVSENSIPGFKFRMLKLGVPNLLLLIYIIKNRKLR